MYPPRSKGLNKGALKLTIIKINALHVLSHFAHPKMADPVDVWDLPIKFFLALEMEVLLQNLHKVLHATNGSSLTKDETSGPYLATCSLVQIKRLE